MGTRKEFRIAILLLTLTFCNLLPKYTDENKKSGSVDHRTTKVFAKLR